MILRLESDGSGGGWKDSVGFSCIIRVFGNGSGEDGTGSRADGTGSGAAEIYKFMVAANIPAHRPVSNKIGEWLGLLVGLWSLEEVCETSQIRVDDDEEGGRRNELRKFLEDSENQERRNFLEILGDNSSLINILRTNRERLKTFEKPCVDAVKESIGLISSQFIFTEFLTYFL